MRARRHGWLDHLARAVVRYDHADGGRLAAAMTYYAFFATFALALLSFAAFGFVLDDPVVLRDVQGYLAENLPRVDVLALRHARRTVGTWPPPPEAWADRLIEAINEAADSEPDPEQRSKLRRLAGAVAEVGRGVFSEVIATVITKSAGMG